MVFGPTHPANKLWLDHTPANN